MTDSEKWAGDGMDQEDLIIPEIKLIQNTGGDLAKASGAKPGEFYSEMSNEIFTDFDFVIIRMQKTRTYWGRTELDDDPPECTSEDGKIGSVYGNCMECEFRTDAPWALKPEERRQKCLIGYAVVGINLYNNLPMLLRCSGISASSARSLYTQLSLHPQVNGKWYKAKVNVSSLPKKTASGDAFAIRFGALELLSEEMEQVMMVRAGQLTGNYIEIPAGIEPLAIPTPEPAPEPAPVPPVATATRRGATETPAKSSKKLSEIDTEF